MRLGGVVDPATATLRSLAGEQPNVAFEASAATEGESCRDPIGRVRALAGAALDASWGRRLGDEIGGPRGCSHLLTLGQLLGPTVAWALARDRALHGERPARPTGQRLFRRDVIADGHEPAPGRVAVALQLTDLHVAPTPARVRTMERFAAELEVRALAEVDLKTWSLASVTLAERRRTSADLETAPWRDRPDAVDGLAGLSMARGVTATLLERLGGRPDDRPVLDLLLTLAPALIQIMAALSETFPAVARAQGWYVGMGSRPDSCWMWRADGPLIRNRVDEDPPLFRG